MIEICLPAQKPLEGVGKPYRLYVRAASISRAVELLRDYTGEIVSKYGLKSYAGSWGTEIGTPSPKGEGIWYSLKDSPNTLRSWHLEPLPS